jgi:hypothetical protein
MLAVCRDVGPIENSIEFSQQEGKSLAILFLGDPVAQFSYLSFGFFVEHPFVSPLLGELFLEEARYAAT